MASRVDIKLQSPSVPRSRKEADRLRSGSEQNPPPTAAEDKPSRRRKVRIERGKPKKRKVNRYE